MADFPLEPEAVKKLVKKSRSMPIGFGFNPGTADDDDEWLAAHPRKPVEMMGKLAQSEGAGTKSAFGTFQVQGSELHLTCQRTVPQLAKKFKKYLKRCKVTLNVVVLDPNGQVIDSDVEVLTDWFQEVEDAAEIADDAADAVAEAVAEAGGEAGGDVQAEAPPSSPADAAALIGRLKALQPKLAQVPKAAADKLATAFKAAVELIRSGQTGGAGPMIGQLEAVVARLLAMAPPVEPETAQPKAPPDPRLDKLREAVATLGRQAGLILGNGAGPILDDLEAINAQLDEGEVEAALGAVRGVQERLREAQAAREKWEKAAAMVRPLVTAALAASSVAEPDRLRTSWQFVENLISEGNYARALASLTGIAALLRVPAPGPGEGQGKGDRAGQDPAPVVPEGTVAFQKSRVLWVGARSAMLSEAQKLADSIIAASTEDEDHDEVMAAAEEIVAEVRSIDERLQDILDDITNAEAGQRREALKQTARGVIAEYRSLLTQGVFPQIDANPFTPVSVTARARTALDQIARTLA